MREREELAIAFICDGGAGRRGCRGSSAAVERAGGGLLSMGEEENGLYVTD